MLEAETLAVQACGRAVGLLRTACSHSWTLEFVMQGISRAQKPLQRRRAEAPAGFEDGTQPFLAVAALRQGWRLIRRLGGLPAVERHTAALTRCVCAKGLVHT